MGSLTVRARELEEAARRDVTQLSIVREISRRILGQLDLTQMTQSMAESLKAGLGFDEVTIALGADPPRPADGPSVAVCPIRGPETMLGLLVVDKSHSGRSIDSRERELLDLLAEQLAIAIEKASLVRQAERRGQAAESLAELGHLVSQSLDPREVGQRIVESLKGLLDLQFVSLFQVLPGSEDLAAVLVAEELRSIFGPELVSPKGIGVAGLSVRDRRSVSTPDLLTDPRITLTQELRDRIKQNAYRAVLAVPLLIQDRVIGALSVAALTGRAFTEEEIRLAEAFAVQAAVALENARLYAEVRDTRDFLQSIAENSVEAIVTTDVHGRISYFSPGAERMFGYRAEEVLGQPAPAYYRSAPDEARVAAERLRVEGHLTNYEMAVRAKDGHWVEVDSSISHLRDARGATAGRLGVIRDITERKRVEEELQRQREALYHAEKLAAMGQLLAGVAHELNNPLTVIKGHTAMLRRETDGPLEQRAEKIAQAADHCARIVKNFLALARRHPPERSQVELNRVVREAVELLAYSLRLDNVEATLNLAEDLPVLWADPHQLRQVMVNLVSNAHDAMRQTPSPRQLTVATRYDAGTNRLHLEVADTGPGIPLEIQPRVFEPFFTTKPVGQGTGLGLSLCQGIIESHGGVIRAENQPGQGAVFRAELPLGAPPMATAKPPATEAVAGLAAAKAILVVDDEPEVANLLAEMLSVDGHHVETAANGLRALDKLRERAYDVILSDMRMPELDGPGLYRELEREHPRLLPRVIFLTGDTLSPEIRKFLEQTAAPNLSKPVDMGQVRQALRRALATSAAEAARTRPS